MIFILQMLHLESSRRAQVSAETADCRSGSVEEKIRPEEEVCSFTAIRRKSAPRRRSAVGATEEEASAFVGARIRGERSETSPRIWSVGR